MLDRLLTILNGTLTKLALLVDSQGKQQKKQHDELVKAVSSLASEVKQQKPPVVNVQAPTVNIPDVLVPEITVPQVVVPDIKVPKIELPPIVVPKPEVTVNVPEIKVPTPQVTVQAPEVNVTVPDTTEVKGFKDFAKSLLTSLKALTSKTIHDDVDRLNPIPVLQVDENGNPVKPQSAGSVVSLGGASSGPADEGFGIPKHSERVLSRDGFGKLSSITYKLGSTTVATLTLTRDGSGKVTNITRT